MNCLLQNHCVERGAHQTEAQVVCLIQWKIRVTAFQAHQKQTHDRREKIEQYLKDQTEKNISPQVSLKNQQLNCMKEDLFLKRKLSEILIMHPKCLKQWKV